MTLQAMLNHIKTILEDRPDALFMQIGGVHGASGEPCEISYPHIGRIANEVEEDIFGAKIGDEYIDFYLGN